MKRDLSHEQFVYRATKLGFKPAGFMGYWEVSGGLSVSVYNAGKRRRDWLRYLIRENNRALDRAAQNST